MSLIGRYITVYLSPYTTQVTAVFSWSQKTLLQHEENMSNFRSCCVLVSRKYGQQLFLSLLYPVQDLREKSGKKRQPCGYQQLYHFW